jgi:hypothetical protein
MRTEEHAMSVSNSPPVLTVARELPSARELLLRWIAANEAKRKAQQLEQRLRVSSR